MIFQYGLFCIKYVKIYAEGCKYTSGILPVIILSQIKTSIVEERLVVFAGSMMLISETISR